MCGANERGKVLKGNICFGKLKSISFGRPGGAVYMQQGMTLHVLHELDVLQSVLTIMHYKGLNYLVAQSKHINQRTR